jgi:hypothetical protein
MTLSRLVVLVLIVTFGFKDEIIAFLIDVAGGTNRMITWLMRWSLEADRVADYIRQHTVTLVLKHGCPVVSAVTSSLRSLLVRCALVTIFFQD